MRLKFKVTKDHILKGKPRQSYHCAAACALQEQYQCASVSGICIRITKGGMEYTFNRHGVEGRVDDSYFTEWEAFGAFIERYDRINEDDEECMTKKRDLYDDWEGEYLTFDLGEHTDKEAVT